MALEECNIDLPIKAGIYKLSWPDQNEYFYYGQTINLWSRRRQHFSRLKKGNHDNQILQRLYCKYGLPEFEFVWLCDLSGLDQREQALLDTFIDNKHCCNIAPFIDSPRGIKITSAGRRRLSLLRKGKELSKEHRESISKGLVNAYKKGRMKRDRNGSNNSFWGRCHSEETKNKMTGKSKGVGGSNVKAKITLNLETGIFYDYAGEAAATTSITASALRAKLNGQKRNNTSFIYA